MFLQPPTPKESVIMFEVETEAAIYELEFIHCQVNITARCNMKCEHCRGSYAGHQDMALDTFDNILKFCRLHLGQRSGYLVSGGEPLLHPRFRDFLTTLRQYTPDKEFATVTTNGYFLTPEILDFLQSLEFPDLRISISLDSVKPEEHNAFRHCSDAFEKAIAAIKLIAGQPGVKSIVRATITKKQLADFSAMVDLVGSLGANILSYSSVIPVGRACHKEELYFGPEAKKELIELAVEHNRPKDKRLIVDVNDPLYYLTGMSCAGSTEYGGCIAGIGCFSVEPDGSMLPCPVMPNQVIMNVNGLSPQQMLANYVASPFVHALLDRNFTGKCGRCDLRMSCGGCRARAEGMTGDYLSEDTDCWLKI
jgi:radical SAM protein with 4Fe4S-binding SPASM domain